MNRRAPSKSGAPAARRDDGQLRSRSRRMAWELVLEACAQGSTGRRARGFHPHSTGVGERSHLLSRDVNLETHIQDVMNLIKWEELTDIVLCGHSYGGCVISGVADRIPARIRALAYVDAFVLENGENLAQHLHEETYKMLIEGADAGDGWKVPPIRSWTVPKPIGSFALRQNGGAICAMSDGFYFLDFASGNATPVPNGIVAKPGTNFNDSKTDARGRFIAGTMDAKFANPIGSIYSVDGSLACSVLEPAIGCTNGPCFSPDNRKFYCSDSIPEPFQSMTMTSPAARLQISVSLPQSRVWAVRLMAPLSTLTAISGPPSPAEASSPATDPMVRLNALSTYRCPSSPA
jgi:pimeloyl-ACP methyl ester carboxylesterase